MSEAKRLLENFGKRRSSGSTRRSFDRDVVWLVMISIYILDASLNYKSSQSEREKHLKALIKTLNLPIPDGYILSRPFDVSLIYENDSKASFSLGKLRSHFNISSGNLEDLSITSDYIQNLEDTEIKFI